MLTATNGVYVIANEKFLNLALNPLILVRFWAKRRQHVQFLWYRHAYNMVISENLNSPFRHCRYLQPVLGKLLFKSNLSMSTITWLEK